jgi:N6-adenosine-specific RNA methylase IME4
MARTATSPTQRTLAYLRRAGFLVAVVERWLPHANLRQDLWGFADVLAVHPPDGLFLLIQVTTAGHVAHRLAKAKARPELAAWLRAGGRFVVHGWSRRKNGKWEVKQVEVRGEDLAGVVLCVPRPRRARKGERQRELFLQAFLPGGGGQLDNRPELLELPIEALDDHPQNPRVLLRDDVVEGIAASLNGSFPRQHALHVRPQGDRYEILSGHQRKRAAAKAGLKKVWCWVEKLDDTEAYMVLATGNNQGELSPLEIGLHALHCVGLAEGGRGKKGGLSEYAERLGRDKKTISEYRHGAEVAINSGVDPTVLINKAQHLAEIHALPQACWEACVAHVVKAGLSAVETRELVKGAREFLDTFKVPTKWAAYLDPARCCQWVFAGTERAMFGRLLDLAAKVHTELAAEGATADLAAEWHGWLSANAGADSWDVRKAQDERLRLEQIAWERKNKPAPDAPAASLILADPPWRYDDCKTENRRIENQYPSATLDEIIAHLRSPRVPRLAEDCVLFLWAPPSHLPEALAVMTGWGFTYKTCAVWDKQKIGMGYWFRHRHELLLVGTRGDVRPPAEADRVSSVFVEGRRGHSEKPCCVYEWIDKAFPMAVKLEMYARRQRLGWLTFGNEV